MASNYKEKSKNFQNLKKFILCGISVLEFCKHTTLWMIYIDGVIFLMATFIHSIERGKSRSIHVNTYQDSLAELCFGNKLWKREESIHVMSYT